MLLLLFAIVSLFCALHDNTIILCVYGWLKMLFWLVYQGTTDKQLPPDASLEQNFDQLSPDDKKAEMIKVRGVLM
jgi:hypothetical protein